ncbi:MAG: signal peptidase II, partial [Candidatus Omnitrophica bacterium]|nr:signal peptidase II [Candidatus Omnitrophota bacterium]
MEVIRNSFAKSYRPEGKIIIWMGENLYLADLAKAKATCIKQGLISNWLRKDAQITISADTVYLSSGRTKRWLIERIDIDTSGRLRRKVIATGTGEKSIYSDDNAIFILSKSKAGGETKFKFYDIKLRNWRERTLGKGVFKLIHYGQQRYYFERESPWDVKNVSVYELASDKLEELDLEPVRMGSRDIIGWQGRIYYLVRGKGNTLHFMRQEADKEQKIEGSLPAAIADSGEMFDLGRYIILKACPNKGEPFKYWVLDMERDILSYAGEFAETESIQNYLIPEGIMFVGQERGKNELSGYKFTLPERSKVAVNTQRLQENRISWEKHLIDNLLYTLLSAQLNNEETIILLAYIDHKIFSRLTLKTIASLREQVVKDTEDSENLLRFFGILEPVLAKYDSQALNTIVGNWMLQYQLEPQKAEGFLTAVMQEYDIGGNKVTGVELLESNYSGQAPELVRGFWMGLKMDRKVDVPKADTITPMFRGRVVVELKDVPLALISFIHDARRQEVNRAGLRLEEYKRILESLLGVDASDYDGEIKSAISGQDPTTYPREVMVQNPRDASGEDIHNRIYVVKAGTGGYYLVSETRDTAGMDAWLIFNKLWPLDETTKKRHMGQGVYTIWAEGEAVEIETTLGQGLGYFLKASRQQDGRIKFDAIGEVELPLYSEGGPKGSWIRRIRHFATLEEAMWEYLRLEERLRFYGGAVNDVDIYLNGEIINEAFTHTSGVRFGKMGDSTLRLGGKNNRVTHNSLAMPSSLNNVAMRDFYWQLIPFEVQAELLTNGVTTDIPEGLLLTKARTGPAHEEYLPYIRKSEALKSMLLLLGRVNEITNPLLRARIGEALEEAEEAEKENPDLDKMAYYLNYQDSDNGGQRQFHLVPEEFILAQWYQLAVRIKIEVKDGQGQVKHLSLLDVYRLENNKTLSTKKYEIPDGRYFSLPDVQQEDPGESLSYAAKSHLRTTDYMFTVKLLHSLLNWMGNVKYEMGIMLSLVFGWETLRKIRLPNWEIPGREILTSKVFLATGAFLSMDLVSKYLVSIFIPLGEGYAYFGANLGIWHALHFAHPLMAVLGLIGAIIIFLEMYKNESRDRTSTKIAGALLLGGILGNSIDILFGNGVIDFICSPFGILNMADLFIFSGASIFAIESIVPRIIGKGQKYQTAKRIAAGMAVVAIVFLVMMLGSLTIGSNGLLNRGGIGLPSDFKPLFSFLWGWGGFGTTPDNFVAPTPLNPPSIPSIAKYILAISVLAVGVDIAFSRIKDRKRMGRNRKSGRVSPRKVVRDVSPEPSPISIATLDQTIDDMIAAARAYRATSEKDSQLQDEIDVRVVEELLRNICATLNIRDANLVKVKTVFDAKLHGMYFKKDEFTLYINLLRCQKELKALNDYINGKELDRWDLLRTWLRIAVLEVAYQILPTSDSRLKHFRDTILSLHRGKISINNVLDDLRQQKGNATALGSIIAGLVSIAAGFAVWKLIPWTILANISGIGLGLIGLFFIAQAMAIVYAFVKQGGIRGQPYTLKEILTTAIAKPNWQHPAFDYLPGTFRISIDRHERVHKIINKKIHSHILAKVIGELLAYPTQALYLLPDIIKSLRAKTQKEGLNKMSEVCIRTSLLRTRAS